MAVTDAASSANIDAFFTAPLAEADPEVAEVVRLELGRQRDEIELIASENIVSPTNMQRDIRAAATTAVANSSTSPSGLRPSG